ncbi:hypothetical protein [Thauera chlorobenzoica]|uniref:Uncharacterized protein n=1 Tax=Thauera chlorobenzoica TaxID=96773 RepID=A0A1H5U9F2_9RHOO|nr:hypothetical protein [Thauera chlorobenzoica]APR03797.1 hypothetical protein Tchl_0934 [Thauera chlorobenzoica]SEF71599.1 hypothetical protein SAMN05216242_104123 [Thauera chlorobenzoica]
MSDFEVILPTDEQREIQELFEYWIHRAFSREAGAVLAVAEVLLRLTRAIEQTREGDR